VNKHGFYRTPDIYRPHKDCERQPVHVGYDTDKTEIVQLGKQKYRREKVRNRSYFAGIDVSGKDIMIPYQTSTLVKVREAPQSDPVKEALNEIGLGVGI
jgi:hypothetical protein